MACDLQKTVASLEETVSNSKEVIYSCLYPSMGNDVAEVKPRLEVGMDPQEFVLRQLYPSMYGEEWLDAYYERWKDDWD